MDEHYENLIYLFKKLQKIDNILDVGSGKTSLGSLIKYFGKTHIDAVIFPNDERKITSIINNIASKNYNLIEMDIVKNKIIKKYDLVLAHLLLGESIKWGSTFKDLLHKLLKIQSEYYIIYDFKEDTEIDYKYLEKYLVENKYEILEKKEFEKENPQIFNNFIGKTYVEYLIKKQLKNREETYCA
jgi:hypothetical protein